jgi:hypothetical protein
MSKIRLVTEVPFPEADVKIGFKSPVAFMGSCFSVHMASEMENSGLPVWRDPFGISFNPISLAENLLLCLEGKEIDPSELFEHEGRFRHFRFHSSCSGAKREQTCSQINRSLTEFKNVLASATHLFVTFGTAWVYRKGNLVVNNCHKLPAERFERGLLRVEEIVKAWEQSLSALKELNPAIQIAFSLSPVRHWKDGAEGNSLSKAILRLAIEEIQKKAENASYIPSYEFMMDECRDYRFYADDLLHPSSMAISLIWERLSKAYLNVKDEGIFKKFRALKKREAHRPMASGTEGEEKFIKHTEDLREALERELGNKRWTAPT